MNREHLKLALLVLGIAVMVVFAGVRVWPHVQARGPAEQFPGQRELERTVKNAVVPTYDDESLAAGVEDLRGRADGTVRAALLGLADSMRPSGTDAAAIAKVFAEFLILNRSGTEQDAIASYRRRGDPLPPQLANENPEHRAVSWAQSTAWARHGPIDPALLRAEVAYFKGERVKPRRDGWALDQRRAFRTGGHPWNADHRYTIYEIIIPARVPNLDGRSEHDAEVCVLIANDGPGGRWSVLETAIAGLPQGKMCVPPLP